MTDEYYQKKRLEEMQKQTRCMEEQNKLLDDIKDIGMVVNVKLSFLIEKSVNPLGVTQKDVDRVAEFSYSVMDDMEKRWSK